MSDLLKMCETDDGHGPAVGTGKRPIRWCRACYIAQCGNQFEAWKVSAVVDQAENVEGIACAITGEAVTSGGTVWLDPAEVHIGALRYAGFIEPLPPAAPVKAAKTEA